MPNLEPYSRKLGYSYCLGLYPSLMLMEARPSLALRLLVSPDASGEGPEKLRHECALRGVRIEEASRVLRRESGKDNCFAGIVFKKDFQPLDPALPHAVLCQVSDEGNLGTILRSALGFDYLDVAIIRPAADVFNPRVVRATMGAMFRLRVCEFDSFEAYEAAFPGRKLYPFMLDGASALGEVAPTAPIEHSLVFGNEAKGLDAGFQSKGQSVLIPQSNKLDSLNLSVAASIAMYAFRQSRKDDN
ncbi:MAG: TrmH family RNA methyltransferase [Clostridiales bacterium]|nr:TrmH family RNA methyltransferase [Clostridiales bacterium]